MNVSRFRYKISSFTKVRVILKLLLSGLESPKYMSLLICSLTFCKWHSKTIGVQTDHAQIYFIKVLLHLNGNLEITVFHRSEAQVLSGWLTLKCGG